MDKLVDARQGLATAKNERFLRQWFEVRYNKISFDSKSIQESIESNKKWFPYNKGGSYRKWYGNYDYVVNWENDAQEIRNFKWANGKNRSVIRNENYYFREAITWSLITSGGLSLRFRSSCSIHDVVGMSVFSEDRLVLISMICVLNSKVGDFILKILNPTISLQVGDLQKFPVIKPKKDEQKYAEKVVNDSKTDWDSFETSWNFQTHPFLTHIAEHNLSPPMRYHIF